MDNLTESILSAILRESTARTVNGAFEQFLESAINIPDGIRSIASDSQNHLRDFLASEHRRDNTFPRVLSRKDTDFLGGSFARHTKIRPLDDIDIYFPLDGFNLIYTQNGIRLPHTVISDGVLTTNPLLNYQWMNGIYISSTKLISEFASVIKRHYPETEIKPDGQSITIRMTQGETSEEEGLGYDVVPCFLLHPDDRTQSPFYLIPNGFDGWICTNPRIDTQIAENLHSLNNKTYRKAVKIVKYWNKEKLRGALMSYYIELAIARAFLECNGRGEYIKQISFGVVLGFWALANALQRGNQVAFIPEAPLVRMGNITEQDKLTVNSVYQLALAAWNAEQRGDENVAITNWRRIFGSEFSTPEK